MDITALTWTEWKPISERTDRRKPAVYQIRMIVRGEPMRINRFRGYDREGLLTIGATKSMEGRRTNFVTAMKTCYKHSAGNLLYLILRYCRLGADVTPECVQYRYAPTTTERDALHAEALLVRGYLLRHCEPPPLNSAIPDRYGEKYGKWVEYVEVVTTDS